MSEYDETRECIRHGCEHCVTVPNGCAEHDAALAEFRASLSKSNPPTPRASGELVSDKIDRWIRTLPIR